MTDIPRLGVAIMDRDHAEIENLLTAAPGAQNIGERFDRIEAAIAKHFAREEALMREANIPILERHLDLHADILDQLHVARSDRTRGRSEAVAAFLAGPLPHMIADHVATADTISAAMLRARGFGADDSDDTAPEPAAQH